MLKHVGFALWLSSGGEEQGAGGGGKKEAMPVLTKRLVDAATPRRAEYHLFDGEIPGFALRVHPNSSKTCALFYRSLTGRQARPGAEPANQERLG